jgi:hypothetical protein
MVLTGYGWVANMTRERIREAGRGPGFVLVKTGRHIRLTGN